MHATYDQYIELGYSAVPDAQSYARFEAMAEAQVKRHILYRAFINATDAPSMYNMYDPAYWAELNQRGICEVTDRYYIAANPKSSAAEKEQIVVSYSNGKYSEQYLGAQRRDAAAAMPERMSISQIISGYYTPDQLYRGTA